MTWSSAPVRGEVASPPGHGGEVFRPGDHGARLLAGPPEGAGAESWLAHSSRLGPLPRLSSGALIEAIADSGLCGRGGAGFPVARKLETVRAAPGEPLVVANCSESEPASRKDRTLVRLRPQLVLDGAAVAASAVGASRVVLYLHRGDLPSARALEVALAERRSAGVEGPRFSLAWAPPRYVAGESSALVSFLEGGEAKPRFGTRAALAGVGSAPTAIHNVETLAHMALVARQGPMRFREAGTAASPGSVLVTLAGDVPRPGLVAELCAPVPLSELLGSLAGISSPPEALLLGGYGGCWVEGEAAWGMRLWPDLARREGLSFGCGLIGVLGPGRCGVSETARILGYLASESAGQCGPCRYGLSALATSLSRIAAGEAGRRELREIERRAASVVGRGACSHPDGAVSLLEHSLRVFAADYGAHARGRPCPVAAAAAVFPIPPPNDGTWR